jgi:hypothetical protein
MGMQLMHYKMLLNAVMLGIELLTAFNSIDSLMVSPMDQLRIYPNISQNLPKNC